MKKIAFRFPGLMQDRLFEPNSRDNCLQPYIDLKAELRLRGYDLTTDDLASMHEVAWVWFWDATGFDRYVSANAKLAAFPAPVRLLGNRLARQRLPMLYRIAVQARMHSKLVLFLGEPPSIFPINSDPTVHALFPTVFTWNDSLCGSDRYQKFYYPQPLHFPNSFEVPFRERKLLVNISSNKISTHSRELYSARIATVLAAVARGLGDCDLFGLGWDRLASPPSNYKGAASHKSEVYPRYKFALCYENIHSEPGYVTEKIFDCLRANCVPIYWGAENIADYVDSDSFIDRRQFSSDESLIDFISTMPELQHRQMIEAARRYLFSEKFSMFSTSNFINTILNRLKI